MSTPLRGVVLSVFPEGIQFRKRHGMFTSGDTSWRHVLISGSLARALLRAGNEARNALEQSSTAAREGKDSPSGSRSQSVFQRHFETSSLLTDTLWSLLVQGHDVGHAVREARRSTPGGLLKYGWILLGHESR